MIFVFTVLVLDLSNAKTDATVPMQTSAKNKSKKVTLCQKHAKNSFLLVSCGLGTLPRLMELDVCTNQCFKYAAIFHLFYSAICQCGAQYQYHNRTGNSAVAYFHFKIQPLLTSCLPSTSLRPQWSSPEIIQSKFIFYNWKHNYK